MRKFIVISLTLLMMSTSAWCCGGMGPTHNNYMFSVFRREMMQNDLFKSRSDAFWESYTNGACKSYQWNKEEIMSLAEKKGDKEMVSYLNHLNKYLDICDQLRETWDYPTKQQLQQRQQDLNAMLASSTSYKGTRLKPQWQLLRMRANMVLGKHADNVAFWEKTGKQQPASLYRDMMRNIYAGSLLKVGRRTEACDIFAEQGDMVSIKWAMRKLRNLGGIRTIYNENPNSATMNFLVQDFVNNAQETIDSDGDKEWIEGTIDSRVILKNEVNSFINYAQTLVNDKKTKSPALWMAAVGELQFLYGQHDAAMKTLNKAVDMEGTQRMKDNARAIRMIASVKPATLGTDYSQWITGELKWLVSKIKEEAREASDNTEAYNSTYNHYYDILDRLVYNNLVPKYKENGRPDMAAALLAMMESEKLLNLPNNENSLKYYDDYFEELDKMTPEQLIAHVKFLRSQSNDPLEQLVKSNIINNADYYNDLIGTKYLANAQFKEAIDYLSKVPLKFMEQQNISYYLAHRDYTKARWIEKQSDDEDTFTDGPNLGVLKSNPKLNFCREMISLTDNYSSNSGEKRAQIAYDLATRYYQASHLGNCWYLTNYGHSVYETAREDRPDFVMKAIDYLNESAKSSNGTLRLNSLYALAFIPYDPWCERDYDWDTNKYIIKPTRNTRQFNALNALNKYVLSTNSAQLPVYVRKCDELKQFRKYI